MNDKNKTHCGAFRLCLGDGDAGAVKQASLELTLPTDRQGCSHDSASSSPQWA